MSRINITTIDVNYPIAGQDNDSQGFRDNFSSIKSNFALAKAEIADLQSSALLTQSLNLTDSNSFTPVPVDNDLQGSSINNGSYNNFHGVVHTQTVNSLTDIDVSAAELHVFTMLTNCNFNFKNWPSTGYYAKVKVHFASDTTGTWTPSLNTSNGGTIKYDDNFPSPFTLNINGKHSIIEAWTYNGGTTVYVKYLGQF